MKKLASLLCTLALLSGCTVLKEPAPTPKPEVPSPTVAPAEPVDQDWENAVAWWAGADVDKLPTEYAGPEYVDDGIHFRVFQKSDSLGLILYEVTQEGSLGCQYVLRKGGVLDEAFRREGSFSDGLCGLRSGDYDGDGDVEYVIYLTNIVSGINAVILCELDEDAGWTFHPYFSETYGPQVSELLALQTNGDTVTLSCGDQSVSYTLQEGESGPVTPKEDYSFSTSLTLDGDAIHAVFGVGAILNGDEKNFAFLRAMLAYDGKTLSLQDPQLEARPDT